MPAIYRIVARKLAGRIMRLIILALLATGATAHAWTTKPVRIVVPAVAGGTMDVSARILADQLTADLGATFTVDNKRGAGGNVAVSSLLAAPPDGQTLMISFDNILTEISHVIKQNFTLGKDIRVIAAFARSDLVLVGGAELPPSDLKGLVNYLKTNPQKDSFASYAAGSASHYAGVLLSDQEGLRLQHVPFVGSPPALVQVMAGQIPIMFDGIATSLPLIRGGKLKPYAVVAQNRLSVLPTVPTMAELGYPKINFSNLALVIVPAGMPAETIEKIRRSVFKAATNPAMQKRLSDLGLSSVQPQSVEDLERGQRDRFERVGNVIRDFKINLN